VRPLAIVIALLLIVPALALAEGRGDKSRAGGKSGEHRSEKAVENANPQHTPDASRGLERAEERMSEQGLEHERATTQGRGGDQDPGFFGSIRRFFGFGRSQDQMSEQGREHEKATQQERGPRREP
jgi:hypothetical protein